MTTPSIGRPLVTVLLPVYNERPEFLRRSVESILLQTFEDFELLVVDDGSEDEQTLREIKHIAQLDDRVRVLVQANQGLTKALNVGLSVARGMYICRQDSDDWSERERIHAQVDYLECENCCSIVGSNYKLYRQNGKELWATNLPLGTADIKNAFKWMNPFCHGSVCFRRKDAEAVGNYREAFRTAQDYDFFWRLCDYKGGANLQEILYNHTRTSSSVMAERKAEDMLIPYVIRELAKMRAKGLPEDIGVAKKKASDGTSRLDLSYISILKTADNCMLAGAYEKAVKLYVRAVKSKPFSIRGYLKLGRLFLYIAFPLFRRELFTSNQKINPK